MSWWVTFADGSTGCLETPIGYDGAVRPNDKIKADMLVLATDIKGVEATNIEPLPYPAEPRLNPQKHEKYGFCPSFCYSPRQCAGRGACPKKYSCVE